MASSYLKDHRGRFYGRSKDDRRETSGPFLLLDFDKQGRSNAIEIELKLSAEFTNCLKMLISFLKLSSCVCLGPKFEFVICKENACKQAGEVSAVNALDDLSSERQSILGFDF